MAQADFNLSEEIIREVAADLCNCPVDSILSVVVDSVDFNTRDIRNHPRVSFEGSVSFLSSHEEGVITESFPGGSGYFAGDLNYFMGRALARQLAGSTIFFSPSN